MIKKEQLFQAFGEMDEELLERSERAQSSGFAKCRARRFAGGWIAAVLAICILGTTTFASSQDIHITQVLNNFFGKELSQSQETALEPYGTTEFGMVEGGTSVTEAGVTITPEMELFDGTRLMLRLRLELSDGVELPQPKEESQYGFYGGGYFENINTYAGPDHIWEFMEDGTVYCTIAFQFIDNSDEHPDLGEALHLKGIWMDSKLILDGTWDIPFGQLEVQEAREIEVSGHPIVKYYAGSDSTGRDFDIRLTGCAVTPLAIRVDLEYFNHGQFQFMWMTERELYVMTKNGEKIDAAGCALGKSGLNKDGSTWDSMNHVWEEPVNYDEIDYIQIGEARVQVN